MMRQMILLAVLMAVACGPFDESPFPGGRGADVVVVGAGISGLAAALEAARGGATVRVVDMWSIFGGHAVVSHGGLCIVGTPVQAAQGVEDSPELAQEDFLSWGEDANEGWVRYYTQHSRDQIYDWVSGMGVEFSGVLRIPGNSVARFHEPIGRGLGLVSPIYRQAVLNPNIHFEWNFKVDGLVTENERVVGVEGESMRDGGRATFRGTLVVLATGGFQSNLDIVREFWPRGVTFPEKLLAGSGVNSQGSGLALAEAAGAALHNMDHQWNYATGLPDPRYPGGYRGLNASNNASIWVNAQGLRFVNEAGSTKEKFPALLSQEPARYWAIFDEKGKRRFSITGSDWADFRVIEEVIFSNDDLVKSAGSLDALAAAAGIPPDALVETVLRYNTMAVDGLDTDFGRFGSGDAAPPVIDTAPFYAVTFYPLSRKSMGGIAIDLDTRVLDKNGDPIPGLLAVGEVTGFGGINGKAGLEGTFLGPSIVTGRVAGRTILQEIGASKSLAPVGEEKPRAVTESPGASGEDCATCHVLSRLIEEPRRGYTHFENVHRIVLDRGYDCSQCHADLLPVNLDQHTIDPVAQIETCKSCHVATEH